MYSKTLISSALNALASSCRVTSMGVDLNVDLNLVPGLSLQILRSARFPSRQGGGKHDGSVKPLFQHAIGLDPGPANIDVPLHGTTGEIHRARMRFLESIPITLRADARHEVIIQDTAAHLAAQHEGKATEHSSFAKLFVLLEHSTNPVGKLFVKRHNGSFAYTKDVAAYDDSLVARHVWVSQARVGPVAAASVSSYAIRISSALRF
jgi:hypothetical protein